MKDLETGTVIQLARDGKNGYWKVVGEYSTFHDMQIYNVIKCSKTGKSFRNETGFRKGYIHECIADGRATVVATGTQGLKANLAAGIAEGKRKRRIGYLEARMACDAKELEKLRKI
jgi:hypothetical protein